MQGQALRKITFPNGEVLEYILDCKPRKNMYIQIRGGKAILKISPQISLSQAESFLIEKQDWVMKNLMRRSASDEPQQYCDGEGFGIAGEKFIIKCVQAEKYFQPKFENGFLLVAVRKGCDGDYVKAQVQKAVVKKGAEIIGERMKILSAQTGLVPNKVTIKNMTGSWGRCSSEGNISININVVFYDMECIDYVIIHELCHLKEMNHSERFWQLVEKYCPDRKRIRALMK